MQQGNNTEKTPGLEDLREKTRHLRELRWQIQRASTRHNKYKPRASIVPCDYCYCLETISFTRGEEPDGTDTYMRAYSSDGTKWYADDVHIDVAVPRRYTQAELYEQVIEAKQRVLEELLLNT